MARLLPPSFADFSTSWLRRDVLAGLTVWAVLVPEALAYATIAGVPPVVGLYAAVPALLAYALIGSSRHLIVSPMSATAALSIAVVGTVSSDPGEVVVLTAALALVAGLVAMLAAVLRLGFLASFISEPVLKGFIIGLALLIVVGQLPALVGVEKGDGNFFEKAWSLLERLPEADALTTVVGVVSLAALLLLRKFLPLAPGSLIVALTGIGAAAVLELDRFGLELVGTIDAGLPKMGVPNVAAGDFVQLLGGAVGVMLVAFVEGLAAAKAYAADAGYDIDPNRELGAVGVANVASGLAGGMVVSGSLSKTAVNSAAGARSQVAGLAAAVLTLLTLLFLTGLFERLPEATLAAIVITAVVELVDIASLRRLWRVQTGRLASLYRLTSRADFLAALAALAGVLLLETLAGLAVGVGASIVLLLARTSRPHIASLVPVGSNLDGPWVDATRHRGAPSPVPGVLVVRIEAPLVFANADYVRLRVRALASEVQALRLVVIDGHATPSIDVTAASALVHLREDLLRQGADLVLAGNVGQVRDVLTTAELTGEPVVRATIADAIAAAPRGND